MTGRLESRGTKGHRRSLDICNLHFICVVFVFDQISNLFSIYASE